MYIEEQWKSFEKRVLHRVPTETRNYLRPVFFAGVATGIEILTVSEDKDKVTNALAQELMDFVNEV